MNCVVGVETHQLDDAIKNLPQNANIAHVISLIRLSFLNSDSSSFVVIRAQASAAYSGICVQQNGSFRFFYQLRCANCQDHLCLFYIQVFLMLITIIIGVLFKVSENRFYNRNKCQDTH